MASGQNRRQKLWSEAEPIINHALIVILLELSLLVIGLLTHYMKMLMPEQVEVFSEVEKLDSWTSLVLLSLFASYTILLVFARLMRSVLGEFRHGHKVLGDGSNES